MLLALNPYLAHYTRAFAFSIFLYLLPYRQPLRAGFPEGEQQARVPSGCRFVSISVYRRPCLYAEGANYPAPDEFGPSGLDPLPFWSRCSSSFHLFALTTLTTVTFG